MNSPARAHLLRSLAAIATGDPDVPGASPMPDDGPVATEYQFLLAALGQDLSTLRNIQSIERKIAAKREMIGRYRPWVEGAMAGNAGTQDEIVGTVLVWSIDIADWALALPLAAYVLGTGIALPERYLRKPAVLIAEEVATAGLTPTPTVDLETLLAIDALTVDHDMHQQVSAKLKKAIGLALKARADAFDPEAESASAGGRGALIDAALAAFHRALELNEGCGVKKLIDGLERERKKLASG